MRMNTILFTLFLISTFGYGIQEVEFSVMDDGILKILDDYEISVGDRIDKDLKIIGGDLVVGGTVDGEITAIGGNVTILPTAVVNGRIVVLGGELAQSSDAQINGEVVEFNQNKWSISRDNYKEEEHHYDWKHGDSHLRSLPFTEDVWARYNRAEGVFLQLNMLMRSDRIPGAKMYGGIGRSFHRSRYYGTLGFEQTLLNDHLQFFAELYDRSSTDDGWRIDDHLNSMASLLIHEDFLDWYHTQGHMGGLRINLPFKISLKALYKSEKHRYMKTVTSWSMFGGDKEFREGFDITEGKDETMAWGMTIGKPFWLGDRNTFNFHLDVLHTETGKYSEFDYRQDEGSVDVYLPFKKDFGIHVLAKYGGMTGVYGLQHRYQIGGIGTVRGYPWKYTGILPGGYENHFALGTFELVFDDVALFYDRGTVWDNPDDTIDSDALEIFQEDNALESVGISFGNELRLDIIKPIGIGKKRDISLNLVLTDLNWYQIWR